jgi:transmembrane sensor
VVVRHAGGSLSLAAGQQVTYDHAGLGPPARIDPAVVAAWRNGMLIFRNRPLREIIAEVNRYRHGRIVIANEGLGRRPVDAVFYLDQMNDVVTQVQQLSGARAVRLPGGVVLLG